MLQGNATRALHAAVNNLSNGVFVPLGELLYNTNMLYSSNPDIKGDSQIITKGAQGLLQEEMNKQNAMEILSVVGSAGAQLAAAGGMNIAPVVAWGIKKLLGTMGVPDDVMAQMMAMPPVPPQQVASGGGNGSNPNSNPNPAPQVDPSGGMAGGAA